MGVDLLTFEFADEILLKCDHSNESCALLIKAVLTLKTVHKNAMVLPLKQKQN